MTKKFAERINMGEKDKPIIVDLYSDSELTKEASYVLRGFRTLEALDSFPQKIIADKGIQVYSAKLPFYKRTQKSPALYAGLIEPSPKEKGIYLLVVDERLLKHERLATLAHEISHLVGGHPTVYHRPNNERETQKQAIQALAKIVKGYDIFSSEEDSQRLAKKSGVKFHADEIEKNELRDALQYLISSGPYFGITKEDWHETGLRPLPKKNLENLFGFFLVASGIFFATISQLNITGNIVNDSGILKKSIPTISTLLVLSGILAIYLKSKRNNLIR